MDDQKLEAKPCSWCSRGGVRGDGNGIFRDVDVDFSTRSYPGIPVCGGCGGLGVEYDTPDFKQRTNRIMDLRFKFHPTDNLPDPPAILLYLTFKELIEEVSSLVAKYGPGNEGCFAQVVIGDRYKKALQMIKEEADEHIKFYETAVPDDPKYYAELPSIQAMFRGDLDEAERIKLALIENDPNDSVYVHNYGVFLIEFKRDAEAALAQFIKSTELEPKLTHHFIQTVKLLSSLGRHEEAIKYEMEAEKATDYEEFIKEIENQYREEQEERYENDYKTQSRLN